MHSITRSALPIAGLVCAGFGMTQLNSATHAPISRATHAGAVSPIAANAIVCPEPKPIVYIPASGDPSARDTLKAALGRTNTRVILAAGVDMDFSGLDSTFFPIHIAECVTFTSLGAASQGAGGGEVGGGPGGGNGGAGNGGGGGGRPGVAVAVVALPGVVEVADPVVAAARFVSNCVPRPPMRSRRRRCQPVCCPMDRKPAAHHRWARCCASDQRAKA